ncbi:MAG: hypothetical protein M3Y09_20175 [Actinomycetota bacterium]|nr:hypothetical protein [Actinomycetota bacterium]
MVTVVGATLCALAVATVALAVSPAHGKHYSGSGEEYMNNHAGPGGYGDAHQRSSVSFRISRDGRHVLGFVGGYDFYCGAGHSTVVDKSIVIRRDGTFRAAGSYPSISYGRHNGTHHATISGRFIGNGQTARVTYSVVTHFFIDPHHPCGTIVRAAAHAR